MNEETKDKDAGAEKNDAPREGRKVSGDNRDRKSGEPVQLDKDVPEKSS